MPLPTPPSLFTPPATFEGERRGTCLIPSASDSDMKDGHFIGATLHLPAKPPQEPRAPGAVLLLPGWSGPRTGPAELLVFLASRLAQAGHWALRIDLHGRGDSDGRFEACDLDRMIADASAGLDYLKNRVAAYSIASPTALPLPPPPGGGGTVIVGGICSGSNVALGLASLRPQEIQTILALSVLPFQPARTEAFEQRRRWKNVKQYARKALRPATWGKVLRREVNLDRVKKNVTGSEKSPAGDRNLKDSARDIEKELLAWKGRAFFLWGGADEEAAPSRAHFEGLHAQGCASAAKFETIPHANHNFYGKAWQAEVATRILDFL